MSHPENPPPYSGPQQGIQVVQLQPTAMVTTTTVASQSALGSHPTLRVCQSCGYQVLTRVDTLPTMRTHLWAVGLCACGCWPCVWIPYCTPSCMSVEHHCSNCNAYIGKQ